MDVTMKGHNLNSLVEARSPCKVHFISFLPLVLYSNCPYTRTLLRNPSSDFPHPSFGFIKLS